MQKSHCLFCLTTINAECAYKDKGADRKNPMHNLAKLRKLLNATLGLLHFPGLSEWSKLKSYSTNSVLVSGTWLRFFEVLVSIG